MTFSVLVLVLGVFFTGPQVLFRLVFGLAQILVFRLCTRTRSSELLFLKSQGNSYIRTSEVLFHKPKAKLLKVRDFSPF